MNAPGFLRCIVTTQVAGHKYRGLATAAFAPELIKPTQVEPPDFDAFWDAGKAELGKIPVDARMTLMPEACTSKVDVYHVSFRTVGPSWSQVPARIYGILCEPKAPGRYPAVLKVPGAGVRPYFGDPELAAKGTIVLEIASTHPGEPGQGGLRRTGGRGPERVLVLQPRRQGDLLLPARLPELRPRE